MKKTLFIVLLLNSLMIYSQKIKSITEYRKQGASLIKIRMAEFDTNKNKIKEVYFNDRRNRITTMVFILNKKTFETNCDYFVKEDTCVLRSYSKFSINNIDGTERQTCYEEDSLIRFIRDKKREKKVEITKTYSWEFNPIKKPDFKNATVLIDTLTYDKKGRVLKTIHNSSDSNKPFIETYEYSKKGYLYKLTGTENDTTINYRHNKHQKFVNRKKIKYTFDNSKDFEYVFEYY